MLQTIGKRKSVFKTMILSLMLILALTLSGCDNSGNLDYNDFEDDHLNSWEFATTQEEDQYIVYYYGIRCSYCTDIKNDVLTFANENEADVKVYFIESTATINYAAYPVVDPITGEDIPGTPTMIVINNGIVMDVNVGPAIIKSLIEKINEGSYAFIK